MYKRKTTNLADVVVFLITGVILFPAGAYT